MMSYLTSLPETKEILDAGSMIQSFKNLPNYDICFATGSLLNPALIKLKLANIPFKEEVLTASNNLMTREEIVHNSIHLSKVKNKIEKYDNIISFGDGVWDMQTAENLKIHFDRCKR